MEPSFRRAKQGFSAFRLSLFASVRRSEHVSITAMRCEPRRHALVVGQDRD